MNFIPFVHRHQGFFFHYYVSSTWHTGDISKYMMKEEMNDSFLPKVLKQTIISWLQQLLSCSPKNILAGLASMPSPFSFLPICVTY